MFYQDVPYCGPAHPSAEPDGADDRSKWRWVLFAMFSPSQGADQDTSQQYLHCN